MTLFVGAALALSAVARPSAQPVSRPFVSRLTSPLDHDFADPFVLQTRRDLLRLRHRRSWVACAGRNLTRPHVVDPGWRRAASFAEVGIAQRRVHVGARRSWSEIDTTFFYYTARHLASGFQCISRAIADRPEGPYVDTSTRPFVCQVAGSESLCGSIDPSPFVDTNGKSYLLWKSDENSNSCKTAPRICVTRAERTTGWSWSASPHRCSPKTNHGKETSSKGLR